MTAAELFDAVVAAWRPIAAQQHPIELIDRVLSKHREALIRVIDQELRGTEPAAGQKTSDAAPPAVEPAARRPKAHEPTLLQRAEAIEIRQLQGIAAHEQGLHKLALALKELIDPIPKTPAEISRYFSMEEDFVQEFQDIASEIDDYIAQGGPVGGTLERIAGLLKRTWRRTWCRSRAES
ncbi:MAG: hypothetical protein IPK80_01960 [Nannocystis sp.]|nr:hypothetical protein [Nannocystis sp.]